MIRTKVVEWKKCCPLLKSKKGAAFISAYLVLTVIFTFTAGFALSNIAELNIANRYRDSTAAFWVAEAGINRFIQNTTMLDTQNPVTINIPAGGTHTVVIEKDDTDPLLRLVTATANVNGATRQIQIQFPGEPPGIFNNTMASGGNISLVGIAAQMEVFGPTRISGTYSESGLGVDGWFEDKQEGLPLNETTLTYPDANINGIADEFDDFVEFNRQIVATYPSSEVVYIQSDNTQVITPNSSLAGKKIIFVEGSTSGVGDVNIIFDASWADDQNLTIISTGQVDYVQPLQVAADSQLNIIAWEEYNESSVLYSAHKGVTYAHSTADFNSIFNFSETQGNIIANSMIDAHEALSWKRFTYGDPVQNGNVPPAFEGLVSQSPGGYSTTPNLWKEL